VRPDGALPYPGVSEQEYDAGLGAPIHGDARYAPGPAGSLSIVGPVGARNRQSARLKGPPP
jgi:hypothetical protein